MLDYRLVPSLVEQETKDLLGRIAAWIPDTGVHVETGTLLGGTACYFAGELNLLNKKHVQVFTVDDCLYRNISNSSWRFLGKNIGCTDADVTFKKNLQDLKLNDYVKPMKYDTVEAAAKFKDGSIDSVFADSDHTYPKVLEEMRAWLPKLKANAVWIGHDFPAVGVAQAVNEIFPGRFIASLHGSSYYILFVSARI